MINKVEFCPYVESLFVITNLHIIESRKFLCYLHVLKEVLL
jgi:hypothetical protein